MTTLENRPNNALLVVDVQNGVIAKAHVRGDVVVRLAFWLTEHGGTISPSSGFSTPIVS